MYLLAVFICSLMYASFTSSNEIVSNSGQVSLQKRDQDDGYIVELFPECPDNITSYGMLIMKADVPAFAIARCANANLTFYDEGSPIYELEIAFHSESGVCQFFKKENSLVYTVLVDMSWGEDDNEMFFHHKRELVTCGYDDFGDVTTEEHRVQDFVLQAEENQQLLAEETNATFTLHLLNVLDDIIDDHDIGQSRMVRLMAQMTGEFPGFQALSCNAINSAGQIYAVLRGGCGDGEIFKMTEGFRSDPDDAATIYSPYFGAFKLPGANDLKFTCRFTVCTVNCPGSSCDHADGPGGADHAGGDGDATTTTTFGPIDAMADERNITGLNCEADAPLGSFCCDFEKGDMCDIYKRENYAGIYNVSLVSGLSPCSITGECPTMALSQDHTYNTVNGTYLVVQCSNDVSNVALHLANFTSTTGSICVSYYYYYDNLYLQNRPNTWIIVFTTAVLGHLFPEKYVDSNAPKNTWVKWEKTANITANIEVEIEMILQSMSPPPGAELAFDDILIYDGECTAV